MCTYGVHIASARGTSRGDNTKHQAHEGCLLLCVRGAAAVTSLRLAQGCFRGMPALNLCKPSQKVSRPHKFKTRLNIQGFFFFLKKPIGKAHNYQSKG
jgi:hypothetical protein